MVTFFPSRCIIHIITAKNKQARETLIGKLNVICTHHTTVQLCDERQVVDIWYSDICKTHVSDFIITLMHLSAYEQSDNTLTNNLSI